MWYTTLNTLIMIQIANNVYASTVCKNIQLIMTIPIQLGRISGWRIQYIQIQLKTQIGVSIEMPVHSIVSVGSPVMMLAQANQCIKSFV